MLLLIEFDSGNLLVWVFGQGLNLRWQLNTLMLEQRIQLAFQAAQVKSLPRREGTSSEGSTSSEDDNDDRDNRVITYFKDGE